MSLLAASCIAGLCLITKCMGSSSDEPNLSVRLSSDIRQSIRFLLTSTAMVAILVNVFQLSSLGNEIPLSSEAADRWFVNSIPRPVWSYTLSRQSLIAKVGLVGSGNMTACIQPCDEWWAFRALATSSTGLLFLCPSTFVSDNYLRFFFSRLDCFGRSNWKSCLKICTVIVWWGHKSIFRKGNSITMDGPLKPMVIVT